MDSPAGWWREERAPLRHMMAERRSEKLSLHLSQYRVWLYGCCCFSAIREVIHLHTTVAMGPMPPAVEKIRGGDVPCSTSLTVMLPLMGWRGPLCQRWSWPGRSICSWDRGWMQHICGWVMAIEDKSPISVTQPATFCFTYSSTKALVPMAALSCLLPSIVICTLECSYSCFMLVFLGDYPCLGCVQIIYKVWAKLD